MAQGAPTVRPAALRRLANPNPRPTAHRRGYGRAWQRARIGFLQQHPLCTHCAQQGITRAATVVDHIQPHHSEAARFWDSDNWQALCHRCHSRKTASHDGGFGNPRQET